MDSLKLIDMWAWLNNKQFIFTFENPLVKEIKVTAVLTQHDPRFVTSLHPPYKE